MDSVDFYNASQDEKNLMIEDEFRRLHCLIAALENRIYQLENSDVPEWMR